MTLPPSVSALADRRVRTSGDRPFLTYYDDATGERTELSYATFDNWACKTANLFLSEFEGADVTVDLGSHWTTAAVVFGCWRIGARVVLGDLGGEGGVAVTEETGTVMVGGLDYRADVLAYADDAEDVGTGLDDDALLVTDGAVRLSQRNVLAAADALAAWGVQADTRLLVTRTLRSVDGLALGLLGPFLADGSVVLVRDLDPATLWRKVRAERITAALIAGDDLDALQAPDGEHGLAHVLCPAGADRDAIHEAERRLRVPVAVGHGLAKATSASTLVPADAGPDVRAWLAAHEAPTVGVATTHAEVAILDGEVCVRGDVVTPDAPDWLHTGDQGFIDTGPDGRHYVFVPGRAP